MIVEAIQHLEYEHGPALQSAHFPTFFVRRHIDSAKLRQRFLSRAPSLKEKTPEVRNAAATTAFDDVRRN